MKNLKLIAIILTTLFLITSCSDQGNNGLFNCIKGNNDIVTEELLINEFTGVKLRGSSDVFITYGSPFKVEVEGESNVIDNIELDIQDDIWEIEFEDCMKDTEQLKFYITMPEIKHLEVSGSGDMMGDNDIIADDLYLEVDGSGKIDITVLDVTDLEAKISGSGKILVDGVAEEFDARVTGSGDLKAFDLDTKDTYVKVTGSGNVEVWVEEDLEVKITGSGDVFYRGNPFIDVDISGSGDLINAN